jgi:FkbM family methyltransferase
MTLITKLFFLCRIFFTYLKLKFKIRNINLYEIWCLDFYIFSIRNKVKILKETQNYFIVEYELNKKRKFIIRHKPSSDFSVFKSVIIEKQYSFNFECKNNEQFVIIDAGANCGYTAIYFQDRFPSSTIYSIEPSFSNYEILNANIELNQLNNVYLINKALWYENDLLGFDSNFRDGLEHSIRTIENNNENELKIPALNLKSLIDEFNVKNIEILKIDIEGAEAEIFNNDKQLNEVLKITKNLAIEIHDEFQCREKIEYVLKMNEFKFLNVGELTIASKNNL